MAGLEACAWPEAGAWAGAGAEARVMVSVGCKGKVVERLGSGFRLELGAGPG